MPVLEIRNVTQEEEEEKNLPVKVWLEQLGAGDIHICASKGSRRVIIGILRTTGILQLRYGVTEALGFKEASNNASGRLKVMTVGGIELELP